MKPRPSVALILLTAAALCAGGCGSSDRQEEGPLPQVRINDRTWTVEVARTDPQRVAGLSGRTELPDDRGMLFVYPGPRPLQFWMKDCHIPLDVAFLDADRRIIAMHTMHVEPDRTGRMLYSSRGPAQYALEAAAGQLQRAGAAVGQQVTFLGPVVDAAKADP